MGPTEQRTLSGDETCRLVLAALVEAERPLPADQPIDRRRDAGSVMCRQCGRVDELPDSGGAALQAWADGRAFTVEKTPVAVLGFCARCQPGRANRTEPGGGHR